MKSLVVKLLALVAIAAFICAPRVEAGNNAAGNLAFSFEDVSIRSPTLGEAPFEVNTHWSARERPCMIIEGEMKCRWDNSIFNIFAGCMDAVGKNVYVTVFLGEDDTTPNPLGVVSQIWSNLYPEVNDEDGIAVGIVRLTVPEHGGVTSSHFKLVLNHGPAADNDDHSDFELVLHVPGTGSNLEDINGVKISISEKVHFLPTVKIKRIEKDVSQEPPPAKDADGTPGYEDIRR